MPEQEKDVGVVVPGGVEGTFVFQNSLKPNKGKGTAEVNGTFVFQNSMKPKKRAQKRLRNNLLT